VGDGDILGGDDPSSALFTKLGVVWIIEMIFGTFYSHCSLYLLGKRISTYPERVNQRGIYVSAMHPEGLFKQSK